MKNNSHLIREFIDKLDEIVRGYITGYDSPHSGFRPRDQEERDSLAKGLKQARSHNRAEKDWYASTDNHDPETLNQLKARNRGAGSGSIIAMNPIKGHEVPVGAPVNITKAGHHGDHRARAVNTNLARDKSFKNTSNPASADDGKATQLKRPSKPSWTS